ncbi:hypothetical protein LTR93_011797 [Exophiala xenobiotica]|nr:hypothetical protein LTR93_011797 [Exophiala xenobiotica]
MAHLAALSQNHGPDRASSAKHEHRSRSPRQALRSRYGRLRKRRVHSEDDVFAIQSSPGPRRRFSVTSPSKVDDGRRVAQPRHEQRADHIGQGKDVTIAIDLGTNNSVVAVQVSGEARAYVATYADMPDILDSAPLVPSRVQYDNEDNLVRYGHQIGADEEGVIQWFKLMLAADDYSSVRMRVEETISQRGLDEDVVIKDFLEKIFEAVRLHLPDPAPAQYTEAYVVDILAAQPAQGDGLGRARYVTCLRSAAAQAGLHVRFVHVYSESSAMARSSIIRFDKPGHYLHCVHDGGGGTTHLQMDLITVSLDGTTQREELYAPQYLSRGGEDTNILYSQYIRNRYPSMTEVQMAACLRLWKTVLKVKHPENWSLDPEAKAVLPADFVLDGQFGRDLNEHVFDPVLNEIIKYLVKGFDIGKQIALQRHPELLKQRQGEARRPRQTIWDILADERDEIVSTELEPSEEPASATRDYETIFVSSGGQSADVRLQKKLQGHFAPYWRRAPNPRTGVVDGLSLLHADRTVHPQKGAWARCAYGYIGWTEAKSPEVRNTEYNDDLKIFEARTPSYLIQPGDDISIGSSHRLPGRETCPIGQVPEWPERIVIYQFSLADVASWAAHRKIPQRPREILTLTLPQNPVARELVTSCHHSKDKTDEALDYCVVQYQVRLMVMRDRLIGQIVVPQVKGDVLVTQMERPFAEIGLTFGEL